MIGAFDDLKSTLDGAFKQLCLNTEGMLHFDLTKTLTP